MPEIIAKAEGLTVCYGKIQAVDEVSFDLYEGEILAVIGPNGSGKTTTVECLEGLRRPTTGRVEVFGLNPARNRQALYAKTGIQLQSTEYPDHIRVRELCSLFASFYAAPADWRGLLRQFNLEEKAGRMVKKLSGGEKQRLSILLALLPRPRLLILDELTTGLDPEMKHSMWKSLSEIRECGTTILLVSHYLDEVEALADRLLYLKNGKKLFLGTQEEFRSYAVNTISSGKALDHSSEKGIVLKEHASLEELYLGLSPACGTTGLEKLLK